MTKVKLTSIKKFTTGKDNQPLMTRDGRPYTRLVIGAEGYEKTLSGFDSKDTQDWAVGQEVEVDIEQKGEYLNFKVPKKDNPNSKHFEEMLSRLTYLSLGMAELLEWKRTQTGEIKPKLPYPTPEAEGINLEEEPPF